MVAFLNKSEGSEDFHQIIDFLNLTSIRRHLKLEDADGISSLPNTKIFEQLALMGYASDSDKLTFQKGHFSPQWRFLIHTILHCLSPKKTAWEQFSSNIATAIICLATNRTFNFSKMIFEGMLKNLDSRSKFLMYPRFIQIFLNKHKRHLLPHKRTYVAPTLTQKLFSNMRRVSKGYTRVDIPLFPTMLTAPESSPSRITSSPSLSPQTHPSTSQQPPTPPFMQTIHDAEEPATMPHDSSQPRVQSLGSDEGSLTLNELTVLCTTLSKKVEDLQNDLKQTKLTYGAAYTKLILRVKKLEHKERIIAEIDQNPSISLVQDEGTLWIQDDAETLGRTSADTDILLDQEEPTKLVEDPGSGEKGEKEISTAEVLVSTANAIPEVSTAIPERQVYIRRSAEKRKDKGKAIMKDDESVQKKTKKKLEQERLGHEEAIRLQEQVNEEERQRIDRDANIAKQLQEKIDIARQEQEKYDLAQALELQKELDKRKEDIMHNKIDLSLKLNKPSGGSRKKTLARKKAREKQSEEGAKRQKMEDDIEKEELKAYLDIVPREEFARANRSSKNYKIFSEMIDDFDRQDVMDLHRLVNKDITVPLDILLSGTN
ncbi:hypothetical protein Tco_0990379 [Tanacetum coccineum]|uniref:Synaptobrevin, longin-like domain protein n=1 Tax=Tanacetum coccineum TaxID=301880 RepID=A0ABQ5EWK3_9ASTR